MNEEPFYGFFCLRADDEDSKNSKFRANSPHEQTAKVCDVSVKTVSRLVSAWNQLIMQNVNDEINSNYHDSWRNWRKQIEKNLIKYPMIRIYFS